jgi:natural product precursor
MVNERLLVIGGIMRTKKVTKKLALNKKTIVNLSSHEMNGILGGQDVDDNNDTIVPLSTQSPLCVPSTVTYYTCQALSCDHLLCPKPLDPVIN